jgi:hypothetical protein
MTEHLDIKRRRWTHECGSLEELRYILPIDCGYSEPSLLADALMLERLKGNERPEKTIKHSLTSPSNLDDFKARRSQR